MEWTRIRQGHLSERERLCRFYEHWTLKESYIKAVAVGLAMPLEEIEFLKPVNDRFMSRDLPNNVDTSATVRVKGSLQVREPRMQRTALAWEGTMAITAMTLYCATLTLSYVQSDWHFEQQWLDDQHVVAVATCPLARVDREFATAAYAACAIQASQAAVPLLEPSQFEVLQPADLL